MQQFIYVKLNIYLCKLLDGRVDLHLDIVPAKAKRVRQDLACRTQNGLFR